VYSKTKNNASLKTHPKTGQAVDPKIRFQGQWEDVETGLYQNLHRFYDPHCGRYINHDPIGLMGGLNQYQYCPNPVGWVDPLGLKCKDGEDVSGSLIARETGNPVTDLLFGGKAREGLPGPDGIPIPKRPTILDLENLSAKHNVEFSTVYRLGNGKNGGGGQYYLYSGTFNSVRVPIEPNIIWINHTHPGGTTKASRPDQGILKALQALGSPQKSSQIIPVGENPIYFTTSKKY
jgi:RHS repeat-associated protein